MKCIVKFLFLLSFFQLFNAQHSYGADVTKGTGADLYPNLHKVDDNFYIGKIHGRNLWLVMERIDKTSQPLWLEYANAQLNYKPGIKKYDILKEGSKHFQWVLSSVSYKKNEMWVAYITQSHKNLRRIKKEDVEGYAHSLQSTNSPNFLQNIDMFVTVTSSPSALITSHMGVAYSIEGVVRTKGISLDLHSFAAKVMLMRNPQRKYMVNAPTLAMSEIIKKALPNSTFIGTRDIKEIPWIFTSDASSFEKFSIKYRDKFFDKLKEKAKSDMEITELGFKKDLLIEFIKSLKKEIYDNDFIILDDNLKYRSDLQKINEEINDLSHNISKAESFLKQFGYDAGSKSEKFQEEFANLEDKSVTRRKFMVNLIRSMLTQQAEKKVKMLQDSLEEKREKYTLHNADRIKKEFLSHRDDNVLTIHENGKFVISQEKMNSVLEKKLKLEFEFRTGKENQKPIISVNFNNSKLEEFHIFDPERPEDPWLSIAHRNADTAYNWIFQPPFRPAGLTSYIAVKLKDLADAKEIEALLDS